LREIYLKGFEMVVRRSQPWAVMTAYNFINGTHAPESRGLRTGLLRNEWGFTGFVVTDWFGGIDPVAMMKAGNDMLMPGFLAQTDAIVAAVAAGALSEAQLDANVTRVLKIVLQSPAFDDYPYSDRPDLEAHAALARRVAGEGMVLLENEGGALPLPATGTVALFGNAAYDPWVGGTGSGDVNEAYVVGVDQGLATLGLTIEPDLRDDYRAYIERAKAERPPSPIVFLPPPPIAEFEVSAERIATLAGSADVAVIVVGRNAGEFRDREEEADFLLTEGERSMIDAASTAFHAAGKRVVVVLNIAGVVEVASWRHQVDAILLAWQPGQEAGNAIADVVTGRVNPSGRLPMTFPMRYADVSSAANFPGDVLPGFENEQGSPLIGRPTEVRYEEGIFVGYRHHETFGVPAAYPFGYGLSYTTFTHGAPSLSAASLDGEIAVTVEVTNAGKVAGREVVQLYVRAPGETLEKPARELRAFAKTGMLRPGESERVTMVLTAADLASFDTARGAWVTEAGAYDLQIGASAHAIAGRARFDVPRELVVARVGNLLTPPVPIDEMGRR
jgi:beta-glucosidase